VSPSLASFKATTIFFEIVSLCCFPAWNAQITTTATNSNATEDIDDRRQQNGGTAAVHVPSLDAQIKPKSIAGGTMERENHTTVTNTRVTNKGGNQKKQKKRQKTQCTSRMAD